MQPTKKKLKLYGFNNLTKTLSFNLYDICYAKSLQAKKEYARYIDESYDSIRLTEILKTVAKTIGAKILNIASQDYDPQGASVTLLISEEKTKEGALSEFSRDCVMHLDKSHLTIHTYPESHPDNGICTFRADIDISTCGEISPLKALNFLLKSFEADIIMLDYRVRGFAREMNGEKIFIDHEINSIQNYIPQETLSAYDTVDLNIYQENIFHTKLKLKDFFLTHYLFEPSGNKNLESDEKKKITDHLQKEINEIFYGQNIPPVLKLK